MFGCVFGCVFRCVFGCVYSCPVPFEIRRARNLERAQRISCTAPKTSSKLFQRIFASKLWQHFPFISVFRCFSFVRYIYQCIYVQRICLTLEHFTSHFLHRFLRLAWARLKRETKSAKKMLLFVYIVESSPDLFLIVT